MRYSSEVYYPTYYAMGGRWGFTCVYCKKFTFGWESKACAEQGMLDHYDECDTFVQEQTDVTALSVRQTFSQRRRSHGPPPRGGVRDYDR